VVSAPKDEVTRFAAIIDGLVEHVENAPDQQILDDAVAAGVDVKAEGARVRALLADAVSRASASLPHEAHTQAGGMMSRDGGTTMSVDLTEVFVKQLNQLIGDVVREGATTAGVAGALIGAGVELFIRSGTPDEDIHSKVTQVLDTIVPLIREEISRRSS
jgi:hypothetical protein